MPWPPATTASGRAWRRRGSCRRRHRLAVPPVTANRSSAPHMTANALSTRAVSVTASAPSGVSTSTTTSSGASALTCSADSVLASITAVYLVRATAFRSGSWSAVVVGLILTTVRSGSSGVSMSAARAASRSFAATPSSRSRITTSAAAAAFSNRSGRSAGQNSQPGPVWLRLFRSSRARCATTSPPQDACAPWSFAMRSRRRHRAGCARRERR